MKIIYICVRCLSVCRQVFGNQNTFYEVFGIFFWAGEGGCFGEVLSSPYVLLRFRNESNFLGGCRLVAVVLFQVLWSSLLLLSCLCECTCSGLNARITDGIPGCTET